MKSTQAIFSVVVRVVVGLVLVAEGLRRLTPGLMLQPCSAMRGCRIHLN